MPGTHAAITSRTYSQRMEVVGPSAEIRLTESDQTAPAGRYRLQTRSDVLFLERQRNTPWDEPGAFTDTVVLQFTPGAVDTDWGTLEFGLSGFAIGLNGPTLTDNALWRLGADNDQVALSRAATLAADTAITSALLGTTAGSRQALAANSWINSNITASGDYAIYVNNAGVSREAVFIDASARSVMLGHAMTDVRLLATTVLGVGEGLTTAPTGSTFRAPDAATGGAGNIAGADLTIAAGLGTGTGDEGTIIFSLPIVAAAGDNIQTRATRLTLDMAGSSTVLTVSAAQATTISTTTGDLTFSAAAGADVLIGDNVTILYVDGGAGSIGVNVAATDYTLVRIGGAFTSGGASTYVSGLRIEPTITLHSADTSGAQLISIDGGTITTPDTGGNVTWEEIGGMFLDEPAITKTRAGDTITNAYTLRIKDAPTEGESNYALWVDAGTSRFDGAIVGATGVGYILSSGAMAFQEATTISTASTALTIIGGSSTTADLTLQTTSGVGAAGADMHFLVGNNGATEAMTILNSGNVGIGTATPGSRLPAASERTFEVANATTTITIAITGGTDAIINMQDAGATSGQQVIDIINDNSLFQFRALNDASDTINFQIMTFNLGSGNVGINTTVPQSLLDVQGAAGAAGILTLATKELTVVDNDKLGRIDFNAPLESAGGDAILVGASIWAEATATFSATVNTTDLVFAVGVSEAAAEKMRLDSAGTLWVSSEADSTTAARGIAFGLSKDTTLFRSAAGTLRTERAGQAQFVVSNTGTTGASGFAVYVGASSTTAHAALYFIEGSGTGAANNMSYKFYYDPGNNYLAIESRDTDGASADADIIRIPDGQLTVDGNATFDANAFDFACEQCGYHDVASLTCPRCGHEMVWQDDTKLAFKLSRVVGASQRTGKFDKADAALLSKMGLLHSYGSVDNPEYFIPFQTAHLFEFSALAQLGGRMESVEEKIQRLEAENETMRNRLAVLEGAKA